MFIELNMMITFYFYFQETYNNRLKERYEDNILTLPEFDPDLWMEVGSSGGPVGLRALQHYGRQLADGP
jgi:hypothetical protein